MLMESCPGCRAAVRADDLACPACGKILHKQRPLGEILVDEGIISEEHLTRALKLQKGRLGEILIEIGACKAEDIDRALTLQQMHRTRLDVYRGYLRLSLAGIFVLSVVVAYLVIRLEAHNDLLLRMAQEKLTHLEVKAILADPASPYGFEALRSLSRQLDDPRTLPLLVAGIEDTRWYLRLYSAYLARQGKIRSLVPQLIPLLSDEERIVATVAHEALKAITGQSLDLSLKAWKDWAAAEPATTAPPADATRTTGPAPHGAPPSP